MIRNHNPIIDPSFIKNNILVTFISNLVQALYDLEKLGYYHMDVSLDNIVYQVDDDDNFNYNNGFDTYQVIQKHLIIISENQ